MFRLEPAPATATRGWSDAHSWSGPYVEYVADFGGANCALLAAFPTQFVTSRNEASA